MRASAVRGNRYCTIWAPVYAWLAVAVLLLGASCVVHALEPNANRDLRWQWATAQQVELLLVATDVQQRVAIVKTRGGDLQSLKPKAKMTQFMIEVISVERDSVTFRPLKPDDGSGIERITIRRLKDSQTTQVVRLTPPTSTGTVGWKVLTQ